MFLEEEEAVAVFKRSANGETISKQQRMQNDIDEYANQGPKAFTRVNKDPDFPIHPKKSRKSRKNVKKSKVKAIIEALEHRVEKYDLMSSLARAHSGIIFGQIALGDIDLVKEELQRIFSVRRIRSYVNSADNNQARGISMTHNMLVEGNQSRALRIVYR